MVLLAIALAAWWVSDHALVPWVQRAAGYERIHNRDLSVILGHWIFGQLPRVLVCVGVWIAGYRLMLMPSFWGSMGRGLGWSRVITTGLATSVVMLVLTVAIGAAAGGTFGFHPYVPKMLGDLVSNMYEEIVYRGLIFCAFYGVAAGAAFPLVGKPRRAGLILGTIGSCLVFAASHEQYSVALRVVIGVVSAGFAYAWIRARSLWAPWIPHTLVDFVVDSILTL